MTCRQFEQGAAATIVSVRAGKLPLNVCSVTKTHGFVIVLAVVLADLAKRAAYSGPRATIAAPVRVAESTIASTPSCSAKTRASASVNRPSASVFSTCARPENQDKSQKQHIRSVVYTTSLRVTCCGYYRLLVANCLRCDTARKLTADTRPAQALQQPSVSSLMSKHGEALVNRCGAEEMSASAKVKQALHMRSQPQM